MNSNNYITVLIILVILLACSIGMTIEILVAPESLYGARESIFSPFKAALTFMIGKYHKVLNNKTKSVREILYDKTCEKKGMLI